MPVPPRFFQRCVEAISRPGAGHRQLAASCCVESVVADSSLVATPDFAATPPEVERWRVGGLGARPGGRLKFRWPVGSARPLGCSSRLAGGVTLASRSSVCCLGCARGIRHQVTTFVDNAGADVDVAPRDSRSFVTGGPPALPVSLAGGLERQPGVEQAAPIVSSRRFCGSTISASPPSWWASSQGGWVAPGSWRRASSGPAG